MLETLIILSFLSLRTLKNSQWEEVWNVILRIMSHRIRVDIQCGPKVLGLIFLKIEDTCLILIQNKLDWQI